MLQSSIVAISLALASQQPAEQDFKVQNDIVYSKVGDRELLLDAYLPKIEGTAPAVLVVHGGAWRSGNRKQLKGYAEALTKSGLACFAIDYRLAPDHKFPAQIDDCRTAVKWVRSNAAQYKVDPEKLGAIGYSAGGHLVSLLGTTGEAPNEKNGHIDMRLQVVVAGGAPTDFRYFPDNGKWAEFLMGGDLETAPQKFLGASSAAFADKNDPSMFFYNGTDDRLVPMVWSQSCYMALKIAGVKTEFHRIEGADHGRAARDPEALQKAFDFLRAELVSNKPAHRPTSGTP